MKSKATRPIGCIRCGKPCALVGDLIPLDELCPWCREKDAPIVTCAFVEEKLRGEDEDFG